MLANHEFNQLTIILKIVLMCRPKLFLNKQGRTRLMGDVVELGIKLRTSYFHTKINYSYF